MTVRNADENDVFRERVVQLLDEFSVTGVNGTHVCMVFEVSFYAVLHICLYAHYAFFMSVCRHIRSFQPLKQIESDLKGWFFKGSETRILFLFQINKYHCFTRESVVLFFFFFFVSSDNITDKNII